MPSPFSTRLSIAVDDRGPLCVGLDPSASLLSTWGLEDDAAGVERLSRLTVDAVAEVVGIVKIQVAFFERHGAAGYTALERVISHARAAGMVVIGDAKRGDIESTNEGYADAWLLDGSPLQVDALTVSPFLGVLALRGLFEVAHRNGRGVFVVVASSNEEGRSIQTSHLDDDRSVETALLDQLGAANRMMDAGGGPPSRCVGAVIGAQRRPEGLSSFEGPVLVPGVGAQGVGVEDAVELRGSLVRDLIAVAVSRAILGAGPSPTALREAAQGYVESLG